jgi:hypothetical protein
MQVPEVLQVQMVNKDPKGHEVMQVPMAHKDRGVTLDLRVQLARRALLAHGAHKGRPVSSQTTL